MSARNNKGRSRRTGLFLVAELGSHALLG